MIDEVTTTEARKAPALVRGLGAWAAAAIVVGAMIGQSIFLVSGDMSREVGSAGKVLAVWIVGGVVVLFGAFCYAELGAALPEADGDYIYLSRGFGPTLGFLYGWTSALIMRPGSASIIAAGLSRAAGFFSASITSPIFVWSVAIPFQPQPCQFTITAAQLLSAATVVVVTGMNYLGVRTAGRFQVALTTLKVLAVAAILGLGFLAGGHSAAHTAEGVAPLHGVWTGCLLALVPVMAAYNGFQFLGSVGGEVANPETNLPRAAIAGTTLVVGLYLLANWVYFHVLTFSEVAQSQHVASDTVAKVVGSSGAKWFTVVMILSAFGSLHATFLTGPRVPFAMARDGLFFGFAKRVHPLFHTPSGAVIFQGCISVLLVLTGTYQELYSYTMFGTWIFLALTAFALIRLRVRERDLARPFRVWGYPWTPLVFATAAIAMTANLLWLRPGRSLLGVAVILLGLPFFHHWRKQASAVEGNP